VHCTDMAGRRTGCGSTIEMLTLAAESIKSLEPLYRWATVSALDRRLRMSDGRKAAGLQPIPISCARYSIYDRSLKPRETGKQAAAEPEYKMLAASYFVLSPTMRT